MQQLIEILRREKCSLVVKNHGIVTTYFKPGVRDLEHLLDHDPEMLAWRNYRRQGDRQSRCAMVVVGRVKALYAEVMSTKAIPFLEEAGIAYTYGTLVDTIKEEGDRCQLEKITAPATTPPKKP
ncbi:MAG: DUF1893 domain-containing protein [Porphyromonadaceae bacterium]|nr:MAG: DUF1893 domain-containing protein [Porphyromonadaceae bacterium]